MSTVKARFDTRHDAEFAFQLLEDASIPAAVSVDDAGGMHPHLALRSEARVAVHPDDAERAHRVLLDAGIIEE